MTFALISHFIKLDFVLQLKHLVKNKLSIPWFYIYLSKITLFLLNTRNLFNLYHDWHLSLVEDVFLRYLTFLYFFSRPLIQVMLLFQLFLRFALVIFLSVNLFLDMISFVWEIKYPVAICYNSTSYKYQNKDLSVTMTTVHL